MDSLEPTSFMHKNDVTDLGDVLTKLVNHINALTPQLPAGFGDDAHKTRYLRRAVIGHSFAQQPIAQITSARYTFTQFTAALKEFLQLREELSQRTCARNELRPIRPRFTRCPPPKLPMVARANPSTQGLSRPFAIDLSTQLARTIAQPIQFRT